MPISDETLKELRAEIEHVRTLHKIRKKYRRENGIDGERIRVQSVRVNHRVLLALITAYKREAKTAKRPLLLLRTRRDGT
jgi:hypothetical protein